MTYTSSDHATVQPARPEFRWQRFWVPRTGTIDLSDGGFLHDPTQLFAPSGAGSARQLCELDDFRALALLGEPGIGKSTTLREESIRIATAGREGAASIHADLRAYSSEALLYKRVFESDEFLSWEAGHSHLVLHLDSLDEALLRIDSIANLIADELPRRPVDRLSVRIACRTAVWPAATLETALCGVWGETSVGVFELAPLRRRDVAAAAEAAEIDVDGFFRELYAASAVAFAIKPLTLNLLLGLFKKDGRLPRSVAEIYLRGCLKLCEEQNVGRRDARRTGTLAAAQRLRVASRIAAATMFANKYAVWMGREGDGVPEEDVPLSALAGQREEGDFPAFEITEPELRETLDTGLFTSRGADRMGWAHQGYAEFLAAQYLEARKTSPPNVLKMLLHPAGGLVPQLGVVTAWTASIGSHVRGELMRIEPMILLQGDLANWDESDRKDLTAALLAALDERRAHDFSLGITSFYGKLNHPAIASQLRSYILDALKDPISRRTAISIAEACSLKVLQPELLTLASDQTADAYLRGRAVAALSTCGDDTLPPLIVPFARGDAGPDPQDDLKGYALQILWPRHMNAWELFSLVTPPNEGYVGAYVLFLTRTLPETLAVDDLPVALAWATSFASVVGHGGDFHRRSLADSVFVRGWRHMDRAEVMDPLLDYVFTRLRSYNELFGGTGLREIERFSEELDAEVGRRKHFLLAAARRPLDRIDAYHLMRSRLLRHDDLQWLLDICPGARNADGSLQPDTLCSFIGAIARLDNDDSFAAVYEAALKWKALWQNFRGVFEGIPLASEDARQLRETHQMMESFREKRPPPVTPPPAERINELLALFDAGDWTAWWRMNRELTLTPTSTHYGTDLEYSIPRMPGWQDADAATRQRIIDGAAKYLLLGKTSVSEWIGTTTLHFNDLAAFRAMLLLREFDEVAYRTIAPETWRKWGPAVAAIPRLSGSERAKFQSEVVVDALAAAPAEFVGAVREIMRCERTRAVASASNPAPPGTSFLVLRDLEGCWNSEVLQSGIFAELQDDANSEDQFVAILDVLLAAKHAPAREFAIARLESAGKPYAMAAAVALAMHCPAETWPAIWTRVIGDADFARSFFREVAQRFRYQGSILEMLNEDQLAEIYLRLQTVIPRSDDPAHKSGVPHFVGPPELLAEFRDRIPQQIAARGTAASVTALRRIMTELPGHAWLSFRLLEAERTMRIKTWSPLSPKELFALLSSEDRVLVQTAEDLCELLVDVLRRFEKYLHGEQNPVRALWDRQAGGATFRPVEEDAFSDNVRLFLRRELVESGVIANREVEVARVPGAPIGRRTDIRIDALRRSVSGTYDTITAVIESKGCWNDALFGALNDQLFGDYMVTLQAPVGIYLVGWFDKRKWDPTDRRRRQAPDMDVRAAQTKLPSNSPPRPHPVAFWARPSCLTPRVARGRGPPHPPPRSPLRPQKSGVGAAL